MKPTGLPLTAAAVLLVSAVLAASGMASAQGLEEPLVDKIGQEQSELQADPATYLANQATESGLASDANWTKAYACFLAYEAAGAADRSIPDNDVCAGYESALGIAEPPAEPEQEEAVAAVEELEDSAAQEAEVLAEEAVVAVADVLDDPTNALDTVLGFVDDVLASLQRILAALEDAGALLGEALLLLGQGAAMGIAAPFVGIAYLFGLGADAAVATGTAIATGAQATVAAVTNAAQATADGATSLWDQLGSMLQGLTGQPTGESSTVTPPLGHESSVPKLPELAQLLDDAVPSG